MAIAFRSVSSRIKIDVSVSSNIQSINLPPGHVSGDLLLMFILTDGNSNTAYPPGWSALSYSTNGTSVGSPYTPYMQLKILYRIDNGSLGSSVNLTFTSAPWPAGDPYVLAFTAAYSGCDPTNPIEQYSFYANTTSVTAYTHPQLTTPNANEWLLTFRCMSSDSPAATFTDSVGTDVERVDDSCFNELACALYDSNAALAAGLQTARTTTASRGSTYGNLVYSLALNPMATPATYAVPPEAPGAVTAYAPVVQAVDGGWELCDVSGLPSYRFSIDWSGSGVATTGQVLNANPYVKNDLSDWSPSNSILARTLGVISNRTPVLQVTSATGSQPRADCTPRAVVPGQSYRVYGWLMAPSTLPSTASLSINWYDSSGAYLSTSGNAKALVPGQWALYDATFTAPVSAGSASTPMSVDGTPGSGYVLYGYGLMLIDPSVNATIPAPAPGEDVTGDIVSDISVTYGRDQQRQLNPAAVGSASFTLTNDSRKYSPENAASPLTGELQPARVMTGSVTFNGQVYPLCQGKIDDFNIKVDFGDRTVDFTFLDGLNDLSGTKISTGVYASLRTGDLINVVLDAAGWTGGRDIDRGATVVKYWWVDNTDALSAINDLVKSEGPPAVAYVAPGNTFVFRDRHHRLQRQASLTPRATFHAGTLGDCEPSTVPPGALSIAKPFTYAHGWRDIINTVTFDVAQRSANGTVQPVWQSTSQYFLASGQSVDINVSVTDPFLNAITPVPGVDLTTSGPGLVYASLNRNSGASATLTLRATGGPANILFVQIRAQSLTAATTTRVSRSDPQSVAQYGERSYPETAPWAGVEDAAAIANLVLLHYAQRLPTVQLRLASSDPAHFVQVLQRTISDRIHIVNAEMGLDADFFVERVTHSVQRIGQQGRPPVHSVVLGCEKDLSSASDNPFTFDKRGAGFDGGTFDTFVTDNAASVFTFDDPVQGQFDAGQFGT